MGYFRDTAHFYETVGELMDRTKTHPDIGPKIGKSGMVVQFIYHEPEAMTTIDARGRPTQPGAFFDVIHGPCKLPPDVTFSMKADLANLFWNKKVNLMAAITKGQIKVQGSLPKALKLLPAIEPAYPLYQALLKEKGYENMIVK